MGDWGIKITNGADVTSSNPSDYPVWSKYPNSATYIVGTASFSISTEAFSEQNHNILTLAHNLGYIPVCFFYYSTNGGQYGMDIWLASQGSPHNCWEEIVYNVDTVNFYIDYRAAQNQSIPGDNQTGLAGTSFNFKYYILVQQR